MKYALNIHCFTNTSGLSIPSSSYNVWHCTLDFMPFVTYLTENILIHFVYLFIWSMVRPFSRAHSSFFAIHSERSVMCVCVLAVIVIFDESIFQCIFSTLFYQMFSEWVFTFCTHNALEFHELCTYTKVELKQMIR